MIFWCIQHNAVLQNVNTQIVARWRGFSTMGYIAKSTLLEVVFSVRKCGISFNFMLEGAKNLSAMCHVASLWILFTIISHLLTLLLFRSFFHFVCDDYFKYIFLNNLFRDLTEHIRMLEQQSNSCQKSCHDGDDETESCRGCQNCWMINLYILLWSFEVTL